MGWSSQLLDWVLIALGIVIIIFIAVVISMYKKFAALLQAKVMNEMRVYVDESGKEAYSFAESMQPDANQAEKLERAVEYMQRQFGNRRIPFDYEQARAVIEKAAMRANR